MNMDKIYKKIQDKDIRVFSCNLKNIKSVSIEADNKYGIFINYGEIKDSNEEFLVATHEYGHCMTGSTHPLYSSLCIIAKHEYKADRKAVLDFLPIDRVQSAIEDGCRTSYEFSEYLDVPEEFVVKAFEHYTAMNLI